MHKLALLIGAGLLALTGVGTAQAQGFDVRFGASGYDRDDVVRERVVVRRSPVVRERFVTRSAPVIRQRVVVRDAPIVRQRVVVRERPARERIVVRERLNDDLVSTGSVRERRTMRMQRRMMLD